MHFSICSTGKSRALERIRDFLSKFLYFPLTSISPFHFLSRYVSLLSSNARTTLSDVPYPYKVSLSCQDSDAAVDPSSSHAALVYENTTHDNGNADHPRLLYCSDFSESWGRFASQASSKVNATLDRFTDSRALWGSSRDVRLW